MALLIKGLPEVICLMKMFSANFKANNNDDFVKTFSVTMVQCYHDHHEKKSKTEYLLKIELKDKLNVSSAKK